MAYGRLLGNMDLGRPTPLTGLQKKTGIKKPLKSLKKTSASLLRDNERFQGLEGLFLGHVPQSMSDKHYTLVPGKLLDQAILWLESQYRIGLKGIGMTRQ